MNHLVYKAFPLILIMCVSSKGFGVMESCVLYLATTPRLKLDKFMMGCGDQNINTMLLTIDKQIEHTKMKPGCQWREKSHMGLPFIMIINILLQFSGFVSEQREINKSDFCMSYTCIHIL